MDSPWTVDSKFPFLVKIGTLSTKVHGQSMESMKSMDGLWIVWLSAKYWKGVLYSPPPFPAEFHGFHGFCRIPRNVHEQILKFLGYAFWVTCPAKFQFFVCGHSTRIPWWFPLLVVIPWNQSMESVILVHKNPLNSMECVHGCSMECVLIVNSIVTLLNRIVNQ